jgi:branched-subunit amino acid aminotransferase/4-amino-4-deoxychorismate lyase
LDFHKIAVLNGHFLPLREVRLDPTGTGIHAGWGVYTSVRVYGGIPFNVKAHVRRLEQDAEQVGVALPRAFGSLREDLADLARRNGVSDGTGRVVVLGGPIGRISGSGPSESDLLILTRNLQPRPPGEAIQTVSYRIHSRHPLAGTKTTGNLVYIQCQREAVRNQFDDALILNESDHVVEVATGNVFWVRDEVLYTPSLDTGCLPGTTREILIDVIAEKGLKLEEGAFPVDALLSAREAFISSVSRELSPIVRIDEHAFPAVPGPTSAALQERFQSRLNRWRATQGPSEGDEREEEQENETE